MAPAEDDGFAAGLEGSANDTEACVNVLVPAWHDLRVKRTVRVNAVIPGLFGEFLQGTIEHVVRAMCGHARIVAGASPRTGQAEAKHGHARLVLGPTGHGQ